MQTSNLNAYVRNFLNAWLMLKKTPNPSFKRDRREAAAP